MSKKTTAYFNHGCENIKIAFMFSCPGQKEETNNRPVTGVTGENLDILLGMLNQKNPTLFPYADRYHYRITNAWSQIEYKAKSGRTEAKLSEIKNPLNIQRIREDIQGMDYVIFFGKSAQAANKYLNLDGVKVIFSRHTSFQSLNRMKLRNKYDSKKDGRFSDTQRRLIILSNEILKQLKG